MNVKKSTLLSITLILLTGCATTQPSTVESVARETGLPAHTAVRNPYFNAIVETDDAAEKGRRAILAMQGEYHVKFNFDETVALQAGYEKHDSKNTGGFEKVIVVENTPGRIVLQHILVVGDGYVVKHWRQDWHFEAKERFEFVEDQNWQVKSLAAEKTAGAWTQCVFEVSDAPRYCGTGKWNHRYGVSTWTSDRTWRPLPRREYTKRDDYNAINAENRHTVTPNGWTHEQDNTKTLRNGRSTELTLAREFGFNDYRSIDGFDFSPAIDYWAETAAFWQRMRSAWNERFARNGHIHLLTEVDGMPIIVASFEAAENAAETSAQEQDDLINATLDQWVSTNQQAAVR
ncbi:MAG: DUF6607 family protein [Woeseiaceae bacterium]